jgi:hypothetical protein
MMESLMSKQTPFVIFHPAHPPGSRATGDSSSGYAKPFQIGVGVDAGRP